MAAQRGTPDPSQLAAAEAAGVPVQDILRALRETFTDRHPPRTVVRGGRGACGSRHWSDNDTRDRAP